MLSRCSKLSILFGIIATLMLSLPAVVEGKSFPSDNPPEAPTDEPRHTPTVKPFGPYRVIQPPAKREQKSTPTAKVPLIQRPMWINNIYRIKQGDTLSGIAPHLKVSVSELATCSGINNPHRISIGQVIRKPGTCVKPPPVPEKINIQPSTSDVPKPANSAVEIAISFAMAQLGDPYVWGGNGPNVWDCSGLVHAAFAYARITISRSTKTLIHEGISVSRNDMIRGDLVFPDDGHVGIYLGGGKFIHAPQSGDVVKISTVYSFYAARRIF